ncbi:MAG: hypothetical protein V3U51_06085, partial [Thermoplasmata archaeon]
GMGVGWLVDVGVIMMFVAYVVVGVVLYWLYRAGGKKGEELMRESMVVEAVRIYRWARKG